MSGETRFDDLFKYGIEEEKSDIRVHVCPLPRIVYAFPTEAGCAAIATGGHPFKTGSQPGTGGRTFGGYPVPISSISPCVGIRVNNNVWSELDFDLKAKTSHENASKAERFVRAMLRRGLLPLFVGYAVESPSVAMQIAGADYTIDVPTLTRRVQVKYDGPGGDKPGSGNLFLQTWERNPMSKH